MPCKLAGTVNELRRMAPAAILSSHLPASSGMTETFVETLIAARNAPRFVGADQESFAAMLKSAAAA